MRRHLTRHTDQRDRIHQRIAQRGDGIGSAGAGGHHQHADLTGRARIALRRMARALLVAHQNMTQFILLKQGVIHRQHCPAGIAEHHLGAVIEHRLNHNFSAGEFAGFGHEGLVG